MSYFSASDHWHNGGCRHDLLISYCWFSAFDKIANAKPIWRKKTNKSIVARCLSNTVRQKDPIAFPYWRVAGWTSDCAQSA
jgi:hypothetical protein